MQDKGDYGGKRDGNKESVSGKHSRGYDKRPLKILQLIYESFNSPYGFGGDGIRAYEIYKRPAERHDITLLCMKYPGAKDRDIHGLKHVFVGTESKSLIKSVLAYTVKAALYVKKHGDDFDIIVENFLPSTPFFSPLMTKMLLYKAYWWTSKAYKIKGTIESTEAEKSNPVQNLQNKIHLAKTLLL